MDNNPKNQIADKLKEANNVLVTVSTNPTVDQLSAAIGLALFLNKLDKHSSAVFSGQVPSTLEFLKPDNTIEKTTDSLRDFIIALDKEKADKLRYKVEDTMVKIFITPYKTSISERDLQFSQGDFNVDVVIAIGVHNKEDLDQAITSHGRILHDATVATVNTTTGSELGGLNWVDPTASSLCEMIVALTDMIKAESLDAQISTALLTGIVAETERFSNEKTSSSTMNASAKLMNAGANQQLVSSKLAGPQDLKPQEPKEQEGGGSVNDSEEAQDGADGSLRIDHDEPESPMPTDAPPEPPLPPPIDQIKIDDQGQLASMEPPVEPTLPPPSMPGQPMDYGPPPPLVPEQPEEPQIHLDSRNFLDHAPTSQQAEEDTESTPATPGADEEQYDTSKTNQPSTDVPILSHDSEAAAPQQEDPLAGIPPPQAYDVFEPAADEESHDEPLPPPEPPEEPPAPSAPSTPPPPPDQVLPPPPPPEASSQHAAEPTLPKAVIDVMDDHTLKDIERAVDSPHTTDPAKAGEGKTLSGIEETVHSPHMVHPAEATPTEEPLPIATPEEPTTPPEPPAPEPSAEPEPAQDEPAEEVAPIVSELVTNPPAAPETPPAPPIEYEAIDSEPPDQEEAAAPEQPPAADIATSDPMSPPPVADNTQGDTATTDDSEDTTVQAQPEEPPIEEPQADEPPAADEARNEVEAALNASSDQGPQPPKANLGSQELGTTIEHQTPSAAIHIDPNGNLSFPQTLVPPSTTLPADNTSTAVSDPSAPPPVPPPLMPQLPK